MKIILFANTDWYLFNYRLTLAKALRSLGNEIILLSPPGKYVSRLEEEGFRWISIALERKGMNPIAEIITIIRLIRIFKKETPNLVHFFTIKPVLYGSIAARLSGIKRIVNAITGMGYVFAEERSSLKTLIMMFYQISLKKTHVIFQNSDDLNFFTSNNLISPIQTHLIPGSGVDLNNFKPTFEPEGDPIIMLAGRLLKSKGIPEFVNTARRFQTEKIKAKFVIVGEPYLDNPDSIHQQDLDDWSKEGIIEAWGWHDDMANVIPLTTIICLPTNYKEGLPRLLLEAGACGRPVVATDIPGCNMVIQSGINGILIPPGDQSALFDALKLLVLNPELRIKMGEAGRNIVEEKFSISSVIMKTIDVYQQT